jgi:hypothetical protein
MAGLPLRLHRLIVHLLRNVTIFSVCLIMFARLFSLMIVCLIPEICIRYHDILAGAWIPYFSEYQT